MVVYRTEDGSKRRTLWASGIWRNRWRREAYIIYLPVVLGILTMSNSQSLIGSDHKILARHWVFEHRIISCNFGNDLSTSLQLLIPPVSMHNVNCEERSGTSQSRRLLYTGWIVSIVGHFLSIFETGFWSSLYGIGRLLWNLRRISGGVRSIFWFVRLFCDFNCPFSTFWSWYRGFSGNLELVSNIYNVRNFSLRFKFLRLCITSFKKELRPSNNVDRSSSKPLQVKL